MDFTRITIDPKQMAGVPCIRGIRIPVATILEMLAQGISTKDILEYYPSLEAGDIAEALQFTAEATRPNPFNPPKKRA